MRSFFDSSMYYLVLFDFEDLREASEINVRIWQVDPKSPGFYKCIVDWYGNTHPSSSAPFNLWPYSLKFQLMRPSLIYHARILGDDTIKTDIFPGERGEPIEVRISPLTTFSRATGFTMAMAMAVAEAFEIDIPPFARKPEALRILEDSRTTEDWEDATLSAVLVKSMYDPLIALHQVWLPK